ncbi:hypothetical protein ASE48_20900 [Mycobacterium sp. Root265]|uniref:hypothetical protein n=1 Tax=Mycobacterium sp. Root265 TaxID=1736504 RepID=UPI00070DCE97|nr:hypothetical protein [Mycobacterium sp. Root265]KRD19520.1 hypothetical protein ASE48_20900 [Mycobacterium sp. Root265]
MRPITVTAGLLAAALLAVPPPQAAADQTALETIGMLEAQGYTVNVDRIGSAPLEQCTVTGIRNPQRVTRWVNVEDDGWGTHGNGDSELVEIVVSQSISVSLDCNR